MTVTPNPKRTHVPCEICQVNTPVAELRSVFGTPCTKAFWYVCKTCCSGCQYHTECFFDPTQEYKYY